MEKQTDDLFEHSSNSSSRGEKVEPGELLEDSWFFGNLLETGKTRTMMRCYSDPSSSSSHSQEMMLRSNSNSRKASSPRTPSLPPYMEEVEEVKDQESESMSNSCRRLSGLNLVRTPSLPPFVGREEDPESDFALSTLIRQASLTSSDVLPPRRATKGMKKSSSALRPGPQENPRGKSIEAKAKAAEETRHQSLKQQTNLRKSKSNLEWQVQALKGFGPIFEKEDLYPAMENREQKNRVGSKNIYQSSAPQVPNWVDKKSSAEDMKAEIKFWARSVAANVR